MTTIARTAPAPAKPGPIVYTDEQMLRALSRCAEADASLSRSDYVRRRRADDPSAQLFERRFGSWNKAALERAGLATTEQPVQFQGATTKWTEEMIVDAVQKCWQRTGSTSVAVYEAWRTGDRDGVRRDHVPPAATIRFRMGSWSRATALACG